MTDVLCEECGLPIYLAPVRDPNREGEDWEPYLWCAEDGLPGLAWICDPSSNTWHSPGHQEDCDLCTWHPPGDICDATATQPMPADSNDLMAEWERNLLAQSDDEEEPPMLEFAS